MAFVLENEFHLDSRAEGPNFGCDWVPKLAPVGPCFTWDTTWLLTAAFHSSRPQTCPGLSLRLWPPCGPWEVRFEGEYGVHVGVYYRRVAGSMPPP